MSRNAAFYIVDIFIAANKIERYIRPFDNAQAFLHSELEWDAVIRELEIIGEATKHLLRHRLIDKKYQEIVDFRNHIVHGYFGIDENIVWEVVTQLLQPFLKSLYKAIRENDIDLFDAVESAKRDYHYSPQTISFLETLTA